MDKKMLEAENAAGGVAAPVLEENAPFPPRGENSLRHFCCISGPISTWVA